MARGITVNTASIRENYTLSVPDGSVNFFRNVQLADVLYDRAQAVAAAYQEFRIKYVKLTFKPSADTFPLAANNVMPQFYFQIDKANAIPTSANLQTLLDMGCRPTRFDDKNLTRLWKPSVLIADKVAAGLTTASQIKITPWLSTNHNSGNPGAAWSPSQVDHLGCLFYVTKINPLTPTVNYDIDVEVVFQFRKPLWRAEPSAASNNHIIMNGQVQSLSSPVQEV